MVVEDRCFYDPWSTTLWVSWGHGFVVLASQTPDLLPVYNLATTDLNINYACYAFHTSMTGSNLGCW